ncbi:MAG: hypothetical protein ACJ8DC_04600 [Gemmatimonadales bacterium]
MPASELWIGLAEVVQKPGAGILMDRNAAFTNVIALAASAAEFAEAAATAASDKGFVLVALEESEPLAARLLKHTLDERLEALAQEVSSTGIPGFGTLFTWIKDE